MPDNDPDTTLVRAMPPLFDAHGHAALLLVESLIHGLCENAALTIGEAVTIAERAEDVQFEQAEIAENAPEMWRAHAILSSIAASLRTDDADGQTVPRSFLQ